MKRLKLPLFILISLGLLQIGCSKITGKIRINYTKAQAIYGDLDSLRKIPLVSDPTPIETAVGHFVGEDFILIGERSKGIHVFDNSDMRSPKNISFLAIPFCTEFYVDGSYLYAESGYDLLKINISNIRQPFVQSRMKDAFSNIMYDDKGKALLGFTYESAIDEFEAGSAEAKEIKRQGNLHVDYSEKMIPLSTVPNMFAGDNGKSRGTINRIGVYYNHIYVVGYDKLHVFNSEGGAIAKTKTLSIDEESETVYVDRNRLYIGSESMVRIYLLDDRNNPTFRSKVEHSTSCDPVLAVGDIAYSTLRSVDNEGCSGSENTLMVLDVESSKKAELLESYDLKSPYGMTIINNHLFVGEGNNGITVFDIQDKREPDELKRIGNVFAYDVMAHPTKQDILIVANRFGIKEYRMDWSNLTLHEVGALYYK